jgi:tetratricopeptide (TPR) repeat protein
MLNKMKRILIICTITIYGIANLVGQTQKEIDLFNEGIKFQQSEKYVEAVNTFNTLITMAPTNASYWYNRGVAKLQLKNYGEAVVDLNKCIYIDTSISEAYFNRHLAYKFTSNFQFALADISKYIENFPNDPESRKSRYALSMQMKEYEYSEIDAKWMIKNGIGSDTVKIQLLSIFDALKKPQEKLLFLNSEISKNSDNVKMYYFRALCNHELEQFEISNTDLDRFLLSEPKNVDAMKLKFENCFWLKQFEKSIVIIEELIDNNKKNGTYYADYGHVLLQMRNWKEAEKKFTQAIKIKTENISYVYLGRGIARYNIGKVGLACQDWERSVLMGEKNATKYMEQYCK